MPEWVMQLVTVLCSGAAVYAGIRADLALAKAKAEQAIKTADHAHQRIDDMMRRGKSWASEQG